MASITPYEPDREGMVRHVVKGGLKHGVYYRVYVTQVNQNGRESEKSVPSYIRIGDMIPPPAPTVILDKSVYPTGCHAVGTTCDVYIRWSVPPCDDLARFEVFLWRDEPEWFEGEGRYNTEVAYSADMERMVGSFEYCTMIRGCYPGRYSYIGVRAVDSSRNTSEVYVIKVKAIDGNDLDRPTAEIHAEPYGIWAIKVWLECPSDLDNINAVEIFRDGVTRIAGLLFDKGKKIQWVDTVGFDVGLTHTYTYRYISFDGRVSKMSFPSLPVTADTIDMRYINGEELKAFNDAWSKDGIKDLDTLRKNARAISDENVKLAKKLAEVEENYEEMYNNYSLILNDFQQLSAKVEEDEKTISSLRSTIQQTANQVALKASKEEVDKATNKATATIENKLEVTQKGIESAASRIAKVKKQVSLTSDAYTELEEALSTQIQQNAEAIMLRAVQGDIDNAIEGIRQRIVSQLKITDESITAVVSKNARIGSSITQMKDAISLCVSNNNLKSTITAAVQNSLSSVVIQAQRVVVTGECLLQGNARCVGRWSSNTFTLVDPRTNRPTWGSDTGTVKPQVTTFSHHYGERTPQWQWVGGNPDWRNIDWCQFTPQPPVNFNGTTTTKVTITGTLDIRGSGNAPQNPCLSLHVYDSDGDLSAAANSPVAIVDYRGVCQVKNGAYVGGSGFQQGFYSTGAHNYVYYWKAPFTVYWEKPLYIGRKTTLSLAGWVRRRDEFNITNIAVSNCSWKIECY